MFVMERRIWNGFYNLKKKCIFLGYGVFIMLLCMLYNLHTLRCNCLHWQTNVDQAPAEQLQYSSIPILGIPVLNNALFLRRLLESIDYHVKKIVVIINSDSNDHNIRKTCREFEKRLGSTILVYTAGCNLGCAGSWNKIIEISREENFWMFVNSDVAFLPGALAQFASHVRNSSEVLLFRSPGYRIFGARKKLIKLVGTFDENIWPAYHEDCDFDLRVKILKLPTSDYEIRHVHGDDKGSGTFSHPIFSASDHAVRNQWSHHNNAVYYSRKWNVSHGSCAVLEKGLSYRPFGQLHLSDWLFNYKLRQSSGRIWQTPSITSITDEDIFIDGMHIGANANKFVTANYEGDITICTTSFSYNASFSQHVHNTFP